MANRSSVAVGDSEMIALGCLVIVTLPLPACTVTGNAAAVRGEDAALLDAGLPDPELEQPAISAAAAETSATDARTRWENGFIRTALRRGLVSSAKGRRPGSPPRTGRGRQYRCGTAP